MGQKKVEFSLAVSKGREGGCSENLAKLGKAAAKRVLMFIQPSHIPMPRPILVPRHKPGDQNSPSFSIA